MGTLATCSAEVTIGLRNTKSICEVARVCSFPLVYRISSTKLHTGLLIRGII